MTINRTTSLNASEVIGEVNVNYSANYTGNDAPALVHVNAFYSKPGIEVRMNRTYKPDETFEPSPSYGPPFDADLDLAILTAVQNIFVNYATI